MQTKSYFEHQRFAFKASLNCLKSAFTAFIHGICPALFEYNTSTNIRKMYDDMQPIYKKCAIIKARISFVL